MLAYRPVQLNNAMTNGTRPALDLSVLDGMRGLAALCVVIYHAGWLLWVPSFTDPATGGRNWAAVALWSALQFGQAVVVFFLFSGFCIHYKQARVLAGGPRPERTSSSRRLSLGSYAWRRIRRLYPPLLLALVLTAGLDVLGARLNPDFYAGHSPYASFNTYFLAGGDRSPETLMANIGLQGGLAFPTFGTNASLWTLSYEFWFYALYPVALIASRRLGAPAMLVLTGGVSAAAILAGASLGSTWPGEWISRVLALWVVWTSGAVIAEAYVGRIRLPGLLIVGPIALFGVGLLMLNSGHPKLSIPMPVEQLLWSTGLACLLAWLLLACPKWLMPWVKRLSCWLTPLGRMSYSLYLVHLPWLFFLSACWLSWHASLPNGIELGLLGTASTLVLGAVTWLLVERFCLSARPCPPAAAELHDQVPALVTQPVYSVQGLQDSRPNTRPLRDPESAIP
jgi:peptidoglycan/LPS O-acetylase OafA/YrhL